MYFAKVILLLQLLISLMSCSTINYNEPKDGNLSRVRFATKHTGLTTVYNYETKECKNENKWMLLRNGPFINSSPKNLGLPLWDYHKNAAKEFYVSSDEEQYFIITGSSGSYKCGVPVQVKFEKGKDYELFYSHGCSVTLSEIKQENNTPKKVTLKRYYNQTENEGCSDAFKQVRIF